MISFRLLWRELKAGHLTLLGVAIAVAVMAMTSTHAVTTRIDKAMVAEATTLLGGDLRVRSAKPLASEYTQEAERRGISWVETLEFASVVGKGEKFELSALKVVEAPYPLTGALEVADSRQGTGATTLELPKSGEIWIDLQLATRLQVDVGDSVEVGERDLAIAKILVFEPDRGGSFFSLTPRLMMNRVDLDSTDLIQPGSRIRVYTLFSGAGSADFREWLEPQLDISHRVQGLVDGRPEVGRALSRSAGYLSLAGLLTVLLAGAAIALTARRWSQEHIVDSALFRAFGLSGAAVLRIFAVQLIALGAAASLLGVGLAYLVQPLLEATVSGLVTQELPSAGLRPAFLGVATGLITLVGFAAPSLFFLRNIPPIRVLKRDYPVATVSRVLSYGLAMASLSGLCFLYSGDATITLYVTGGVFALVIFGLIVGRVVLLLLAPLESMGGAWRFGLQQLVRNPYTSAGQLISFSLTGLAISMIALIRLDLIATWNTQVAEDAPNAYAMNITGDQVQAFQNQVDEMGLMRAPLFPIVRGTLESVNDSNIDEWMQGVEVPRSVQRELALTETLDLGGGSWVVEGRFFEEGDPSGLVTVEEQLASRLGLSLGDKVSFTVGSDSVSAEVVGIRHVQWESMRPNFFMVFSPGTLSDFESTYLTSVRLTDPPSQTAALSRSFPAASVISVESILEQIRGILDRSAKAVGFVLWFVLVGGVLVLLAGIRTSLPTRNREAALLRSLGGSSRNLSQAQWAEFFVLGAVAGFLAAAGTEALGYLLYTNVFNLDWTWHWLNWVTYPLGAGFGIALLGRWSARESRKISPAQLLRIIES